jgi:type I restriction enzyme S subunit
MAPLVSGDYVSFCFGAAHLRGRLEDAAKSTAGHQRISLSDLREFLVPVPPLAEQQRVRDVVEEQLSVADAALATTSREGVRCSRLRQSILKWAFEGRLVDQDPTDEPASVLLERIRAEREAKPAQRARTPRRARAAKTDRP